jgi:dihydrofolate reductase
MAFKRRNGILQTSNSIFNPDSLTNVVIMGRKCWESIPPNLRPLPSRRNIVLSHKGHITGVSEPNSASSSVEVATSLAGALERVRDRGFGRVFLIGTREVYREAIKMENCERILFTEVQGDVETDVDFPVEFRKGRWKQASHERLEKFVGGDVHKGTITDGKLAYEFQMWEREL